MRVIAVTRLWPNALEPQGSAYNRQQFAALARHCDLEVIAAVPYLPGAMALGVPRRTARLARLPRRDRVAGIPTTRMRQYYVPKIDVAGVPLFFASLLPYRRLLASADVVFVTWAYPDACATLLLTERLGKPCCVKVHGSDLNVEGANPTARCLMNRLLPRADAFVSVSEALASLLQGHGVPRDRIHVVQNGVDPELFFPRDRQACRAGLGVPSHARLALYVGNLKENKGLRELMQAFDLLRPRVPGLTLAIVGDGAFGSAVKTWAAGHGDAVRLTGTVPHAEVAAWLGACDVFVLPSWAEGTPNAVLEAIASGRPTVSTRVGGVPEVLRPDAGVMVEPRVAYALAEAIERVLSIEWDAHRIRATQPASWDATGERIHRVLADVLDASRRHTRSR